MTTNVFRAAPLCRLSQQRPRPVNARSDALPGDAALVAAAQRGDAEAFAALHARYYRRIYHLAYLKTSNAADAEDIAGETFVRALSGLRRFRLGRARRRSIPGCTGSRPNLIIDSARQRPPAGVVSLDAPLVSGVRALLRDERCRGAGPFAAGDRRAARSAAARPQRDRRAARRPGRRARVSVPRRPVGAGNGPAAAPLGKRRQVPAAPGVVALRAEIERPFTAIERLEASRETAQTLEKETLQRVGRQSPG